MVTLKFLNLHNYICILAVCGRSHCSYRQALIVFLFCNFIIEKHDINLLSLFLGNMTFFKDFFKLKFCPKQTKMISQNALLLFLNNLNRSRLMNLISYHLTISHRRTSLIWIINDLDLITTVTLT